MNGFKLVMIIGSFPFVYAACGGEEHLGSLQRRHQAEPRIGMGYEGWAICTGETSLKIRSARTLKSALSSIKSRCLFGEKVWVEGTVLDPESNEHYARLLDRPSQQSGAQEYGYADWRWLQIASADAGPANDVGHDDQRCSINYDEAFAVAAVATATRAILSCVGYAEGTGNCYNYMFGYKKFTSYSQHPNICQPFRNTCSTAAGRYQFLKKTWDGLAEAKGFTDFGPANQDIGATVLFNRRGFINHDTTLSYTEFASAMDKIAWEWSSLPPGHYGQNIKTLPQMWEKYLKYNHE
jgi:muramidase (phage lysozyme)